MAIQFWIASFSVDPATWAAFARSFESIGLHIIGDDPRDELVPAYLWTGAFLAALLASLFWLWNAAPHIAWADARRGMAS